MVGSRATESLSSSLLLNSIWHTCPIIVITPSLLRHATCKESKLCCALIVARYGFCLRIANKGFTGIPAWWQDSKRISRALPPRTDIRAGESASVRKGTKESWRYFPQQRFNCGCRGANKTAVDFYWAPDCDARGVPWICQWAGDCNVEQDSHGWASLWSNTCSVKTSLIIAAIITRKPRQTIPSKLIFCRCVICSLTVVS